MSITQEKKLFERTESYVSERMYVRFCAMKKKEKTMKS